MTFERFFESIHGYTPFPWQSEAARRLVAGEMLPVINVPTSCGKTALIDAAIYAAAFGGRRRIAFIIDRRVVVDEAYSRAQRIVEVLSHATQTELQDIAARLGPIQVLRLRGGVHGDDDWVLYPERVTVLVSTVDQVGSRLLHRGYGVSPRMVPLHAGFVGNDALYLIDEAHLSQCFLETVRAARDYGADVDLIAMSATPGTSATALTLSDEDRGHPLLMRRLGASKQARLLECQGGEAEFSKAVVESALGLSSTAPVIGIVVNRVGSARRIWRQLNAAKHQAVLLTGRVRAQDRDALIAGLWQCVRAGRERTDGTPLFVVATQAIEVGADIDFDALVTEAAPLSALRQRFGRLDRLGHLGATSAVIVYRAPKEEPDPAKDKRPPDPIYGMDIHRTWDWLKAVVENEVVDFGITALQANLQASLPPDDTQAEVPALLPTHLALLAQTGPQAPAIDVSAWLHGAARGTAEVTLVWRADLDPEAQHGWVDIMRLRPPLSREAMEVPLYAVRAWLQGRRAVEISDLEGAGLGDDLRVTEARAALCWRGADECALITPEDIRPGDTLVVPSAYGGCDRFGWYPESDDPVEDLADWCSSELGHAQVLRLAPGLTGWLAERESGVLAAVSDVVAAESDVDPEVGVDQERVQEAYSSLRALLRDIQHPLVLALGTRYTIERYPDNRGVILRSRVLDEIGASLTGGVAVPLEAHLANVGVRAFELAGNHPRREAIRVAGREHDQGKQEPRFQAMLHGDPIAAAKGPLLAKSGLRRLNDLRAAYQQSGLPAGFRHELASLAYYQEEDPLIRYLIATHHGYGRPWFPACADPKAPGADTAILGSGWVEARAALVGQFGPWGLAGMELIVRAADARQSMAEQEANHD